MGFYVFWENKIEGQLKESHPCHFGSFIFGIFDSVLGKIFTYSLGM